MTIAKKKTKTIKKKHSFPAKEIVNHVEYEGNGLMILADVSNEEKYVKINSFGIEAGESFKKIEKDLQELSQKHDIKLTLKVFLILE
jgi:hypothetical protein